MQLGFLRCCFAAVGSLVVRGSCWARWIVELEAREVPLELVETAR
jgi:hypothetical protein